jgi:predicted PolB exonuclease-like 3'-5' exonuclease
MGMDGSQVWSAYQAGQLEQIRQYCETDVVNTYLVYCRFQEMRGGFSSAEYEEELSFVKKQLGQEPQQGMAPWPEYLAGFAQ